MRYTTATIKKGEDKRVILIEAYTDLRVGDKITDDFEIESISQFSMSEEDAEELKKQFIENAKEFEFEKEEKEC
jgi:hypothetical protein